MGIKKKHVPGCGCCETAGPTCDGCDTQAPSAIMATVAGIANKLIFPPCTDCADLNITWTCTYDEGDSTPDACIYYSEYVDHCNGTLSVRMRITIFTSGTDSVISALIQTSASVGVVEWAKVYTGIGSIDCAGLSSESIPRITDAADCDTSSATCHLTAA